MAETMNVAQRAREFVNALEHDFLEHTLGVTITPNERGNIIQWTLDLTHEVQAAAYERGADVGRREEMGEKTEVMWAIFGECGLYTGTWLTQLEAIAGHTHDVARPDEPQPSRSVGRKLDANQRHVWTRCKRRGDRAIKVSMTYEAPR